MLVEKLINKIRIKVRDEHKEEFPDNETRTNSQRKSIDETISIVRSYLR